MECSNKIIHSPVKIFGSDISTEVLQHAKTNIQKSGLSDVVTLTVSDFKDLKSADDNGFVFLNPPYGQRIQPEEIDNLYSMIGTTLKHNFAGTTAWLITSNKESLKHVGLKSRGKFTLFNGALECILLKYEMYRGTKKGSEALKSPLK
jgi:putative N6-adenine-specific DNA methylase